MSLHQEFIGVFTILNGQTDIEVLPAIPSYANIPASQANTPTPNKKMLFGQAVGITIQAPATLPETINIQTDALESGQTWSTQQADGGTDIVLAAGKSLTIRPGGWKSLRIHATGAVAGNRAFNVTAQYNMDY